MSTATEQLAALRALVGVEFAVIYGLASGGGRLAVLGGSAGALAATHTAYDQHRLNRDRLVAAITAARAAVPVAEPAYEVPALPTAQEAGTFLAGLAERSAHAYRLELGGLADAALRQLAVAAVVADARYATLMLTATGTSSAAASSALPGS